MKTGKASEYAIILKVSFIAGHLSKNVFKMYSDVFKMYSDVFQMYSLIVFRFLLVYPSLPEICA